MFLSTFAVELPYVSSDIGRLYSFIHTKMRTMHNYYTIQMEMSKTNHVIVLDSKYIQHFTFIILRLLNILH